MSTRRTRLAVVAGIAATGLLAAGCSSGSSGGSGAASGSASGSQKVTISVVSLIPGSEKAAFDAFDKQVSLFEQNNPNITVKPQEYQWTGPTFAAQLAGGTLPTVFEVPFTDGKALIEKGQLADLTDLVKALPYSGSINPTVLAEMQDAKGNIYGLPKGAYGIGLQINRTLFKQAGLDPDKPPTTWDELRADAKTIADKTHQAGFAQMTKSNTGGWMLTTLSYALGGRMETGSGTSAKATINNPATKQALQLLHDMRWTDNSMGSNFLYDWTGINQAFAAGKIGMYMGGSDVYTSLVQQDHINPADYGLAELPLGTDPNAGVLGGGTIAVVSPKATAAQKAAAVKWMDFFYEAKYTDQASALRDAQTQAAAKQPVGVPGLPLFSKQQLATYNGWIKDQINVPLSQMTSYTDGVFNQPLVPEPAAHTQDMYGVLDSVVQAVLTQKDANLDQLLTDANSRVQTLLAKP
jgi:multiple sugar transport system substrate-binding protein